MTRPSRLFGLVIGLIVISTLANVPALAPAVAQDSTNPAETIEALALRVHRLNLRTGMFTAWTGGDLGSPSQFRPRWTMGECLIDWELPGLREQDASVVWNEIARPTVLNIWASWCMPCVREFSHLAEMALHPADHAYDVLFVNSLDEEAAALTFLNNYPPDIRVLSDPEGSTIMHRVGLVGIVPFSVLLDSDGSVLAIHVGMYSHAHLALFEMIAQYPGVGSFDAADYPEVDPVAEILLVDPGSATPIDGQDPIINRLDDDNFQHAYRLEGKARDVITAEMTALPTVDAAGTVTSYVDPYIVLLAEDGTWLAESDYSFEESATIEFALPEDGMYIIVATRFLEADGLSSGRYQLNVTID